MISRQRIDLLLLGSLAIGLLAGAVLLFDETRPVTLTRHGVTIGIEKTRFRKGENLTWWVKNNRNDPIYFPGSVYWEIEQKIDGEWKHVPLGIVSVPSVETLPAGKTDTHTWDQYTSGTPPEWVGPGHYRIVYDIWISWRDSTLDFSPFLCFEIMEG